MKLIILAGYSIQIINDLESFKKRVDHFLDYFNSKDILISTDIKSSNILTSTFDNLKMSVENEHLHTAGAVKYAENFFKDESEIMVTNGDTDIHTNINEFVKFHYANKSNLSILLKQVTDVSKYGYISLDSNNRIERYNEKLENLHIEGYINGGLYLINTEIIFNLAPSTPVSFEKEVFPSVIALNRPVFGHISNGN